MKIAHCPFIRNKQNGLTLIEVVIAIIIMSIIGTVFGNYLVNGVKAYINTEKNITALQKSLLIDMRIDKELREVDYNGGTFDISDFSSTTFTFTNIDAATTVQFDYDAASDILKMDYADPAVTILSNNITAFTFNYFEGDGITAAASIADIAFVEYNYTISEDGTSYSSVSRVMLRDRE